MSEQSNSDGIFSMYSGKDGSEGHGELADLLKSISALSSSFDSDSSWLTGPLRVLIEVLSCTVAVAAVLEPGESEFRYHILQKDYESNSLITVHGPADEEIFGWILSRMEDYLANTLSAEPLYVRTIDRAVDYNLDSMVCTPFRTINEVSCVLIAFHRGDTFSGKDVKFVKSIAQLMSPSLEKKYHLKELKKKLKNCRKWLRSLITHERLSSMSLMAAGVAHEIQSPMAAVSGYIQLIKRELKDEKLISRFSKIETSVTAITAISNGLATFSRRSAPSWEDVDINSVVYEAANRSVLSTPAGNPVEVIWDCTPELPLVEALVDELRQVFVNILDNACQAIPDGGVIHISTKLEQPGTAEYNVSTPRIRVVISDDGPGIPDKYKEKVFMPFFSEGKLTGAGLGLSLCRSVMKRHRGEITFECPESGGTRFIVYVPVVKNDEMRQ